MNRFHFGPARKDERIVFGAEKPGHRPSEIQEWIDFMKEHKIQRVCCLLSGSQLTGFEKNLLEVYRQEFGSQNVCEAPIRDYHLVDPETLEAKILPFLLESDREQKPVVVHCWSGNGRTGHILAAWLVRGRGLPPEKALSSVISMGRKPREAIQHGNATEEELITLLSGPA